jgi:Predicted protease
MEAPNSGNTKRHGPFKGIKATTVVPVVSVIALVALFSWYFSPLNASRNAHAEGLSTIAGVVPNAVAGSHASSPIDGNTPVTLAIGLKLHNQDGLAQYVKDTSSATNKVKRTLSAQQLIEAYSPFPSEQQAVIDYMQSYGFTTISTDSYRIIVGFQGTMAQAESAFHITVNNYSGAHGAFHAPASSPTLPASVAPYISSITGLDNVAHYTHGPIAAGSGKTAKAGTTKPNSISNSGTSCPTAGSASQYQSLGYTSYLPSQITTAYNLSSLQGKYKGEGQTVGVFELSDYKSADIKAYTACYGGGSVPISKQSVTDGTGYAGIDGGTSEAELDMELILSAAPHLAGLNVYEAPNTSAGYLLAWDKAIAPSAASVTRGTNDVASVLSTSWGACEGSVDAGTKNQENDLFMIAAAQGQTIFAAAGDSGSNNGDDWGYCNQSPTPGVLGVQDPASQPYVTTVGATNLQITSTNTYTSETPWNWSSLYAAPDPSHYAATGGGMSGYWSKPTWQQGVNSSSWREVPDISFNGDPNTGYPIYTCVDTSCSDPNYTGWYGFGGTSASAPMMAALTALANQYSLSQGYFNLGFLSPTLYTLSQNSSKYASDFHDITTGNNNVDGGTQYTATTGYDMASGLGTPRSGAFFTDLANLADQTSGARSTPATTKWYFAEGSVGGSFSELFSILNPSASQTANINITYLYADGRAPKTVNHTITPSTRGTFSANTDLGYPETGTANTTISAIVTSVPNANGITVPIIAERPMYFKFAGGLINSGTDVFGATDATQTDFYFAYGDSRQNSTQKYYTYITLLNPNSTPVTVTGTYYAHGSVLGTKTITLQPWQRGTLSPAQVAPNQQVSMQVHASAGIVAERPMYGKDNIAQAGGAISGAASVVGATSPGSDWLFAEGSTGKNFQENLVLSNFTSSDTTAQVNLEYANGFVKTVNVPVAAYSQAIFNVNQNQDLTNGTSDVSIAVHDPNSAIVAERLIYFTFYNGSSNVTGFTDAIGEQSATGHKAYSFSEGYTASPEYEFLTLQNPNAQPVHAVVTLYANSTVIQKVLTLAPQSRTTLTVNSIINPMVKAYPNSLGKYNYNVSLTVQGTDGNIVAERVFYFVFGVEHGATAFPGYTNSNYQ